MRSYTLLQHRHRIGDTPGQGISIAQVRSKVAEPAPDVPGLAKFQTVFECGDGLVEVPFAEVQQASTETRLHQAGWLIDCLGHSDRLLVAGDALNECSQL